MKNEHWLKPVPPVKPTGQAMAQASAGVRTVFQAGAAIALLTLSGCSHAPPVGPKIDPALAMLIPADTVLLVGTRLEAIEKTAVYKKYLAQRSIPQIDAFAKQTLIDPRKELWE